MHHFDQRQATPTPLSAIAAKTERIELGTGVIDMRYENPLYMAELAAMADLIAAGRLRTRCLLWFARIRDSRF